MRTLPREVLAALPEHAADERDWMNALLVALPHLAPVSLRRQNAGVIKTGGGAIVKAGQAGVADITGEARGGLRIEIECKMPTGKLSPQQRRWQEHCAEWGVLHLVARYCAEVPLLSNLHVLGQAVRHALAERGVDV